MNIDDTLTIIPLVTAAISQRLHFSPSFFNAFESSPTVFCLAELKSVGPNLTFGICLV